MDKKKRNIIIVVVIIALVVCGAVLYKFISRSNSPKLNQDEITKIALKDASVNNDDLSNVSVSYDVEDNEYEVDFITNDGSKQYEYTIDGNSGRIKERDFESITINRPNNKEPLSIDKAKEIAVNDAGFTISEVRFVTEKYENDDKEFDIEFIGKDKSNSKEYKYEYSISYDGRILSKDKDKDLN